MSVLESKIDYIYQKYGIKILFNDHLIKSLNQQLNIYLAKRNINIKFNKINLRTKINIVFNKKDKSIIQYILREFNKTCVYF